MTDTKHITIHSNTQVDYTPRQVRDGREWLVVPVVMLVEGVHHGSAGPILHLQENFSQNPQDWNGVPLTVGHPQDNEGRHVSVQQIDEVHWVVGQVQNTRIENGKLKAEAWIDRQRAIAINPEVVNYLMEGKKLEVSTGMGTVDVSKQGEWDGETYQAVTQEYYPDHLALLPGEQGACSWQDGCGIRVNQKHEEETNEMIDEKGIKAYKQMLQQGQDVLNGLQTNEVGFLELSNKLQSQLDRLDSEARIHFLKEIYDDHFVYEVRDRDAGSQRFFQQTYEVQENNEIEWTDDPQEVRRNVEFVPLNGQNNKQKQNNGACGCSMKRTKFNNNTEDTMSNDEKNKQPSGEVMDKVVSLINNERTRFSKTDRPWLLQLNEEQLEKLEPTEAPEPEVTREQALQALTEDLSDTAKLVEVLPEEVKAQVEAGIKAYNDNRQKLVKSIQANTGDIWKTQVLEAMDTEMLANLEKSSRKTDYSGQGPAGETITTNSEDSEMLLPAGVELEN